MIGTSSSSSTEAWLVHPEPDTWLALSASTATASFGLYVASSGGPGEEEAARADEDAEEAASGADEEPEGSAAAPSRASAATSWTSLWKNEYCIVRKLMQGEGLQLAALN